MINSMKMQSPFALSLLLLSLSLLLAGSSETHRPDLAPPPLRNYTLEDYSLQPQNWSITQDQQGQMIVANQGGILRFDGLNWEHAPLPNASAYAVARQGDKIIAAGHNTIGLVGNSAQNTLEFQALPALPPFGKIYRLLPFDGYTIVQSQQGFYILKDKQLLPWLQEFNIRRAFKCADSLYFQALDGKLFLYQEHSSQLIAQLDPQSHLITWLGRLGPQTLLLATYKNGLIRLDNGQPSPFPCELNDYLAKNIVVDGLRLKNGQIALATRLGGLVIIDETGHKHWLISKESGLRSNTLYCLFEDREGNLWLGLSYGIAKLELSSPFRFFAKSSAVPEMALCVTVHDDLIWVGATSGLFVGSNSRPFERVANMTASVWGLLSTAHGLICGSSNGIHIIDPSHGMTTISDAPSLVLAGSALKDHVWFSASEEAIYQISYIARQWQVKKISLKNIEQVRTLSSQKEGSLWCGSESAGLWRLSPDQDGNWQQKDYSAYEGIGNQMRVFSINQSLWLVSDGKLLCYQGDQDRFIANTQLGPPFDTGEAALFLLVESPDRELWACVNDRLERFVNGGNGTYARHYRPFLRLPRRQINQINYINQTLLLATIDGLVQYAGQMNEESWDFPCHISQLRFGSDLVYQRGTINHKIPYKQRDLELTLSAPFFQHEQATRFQFKLDGLDGDWSPWQQSPVTRFTNLPSGRFTLHARPRNVFEHLSSQASVVFTIAAPWYQTPAAYLAYLLLLSLLIWGIIRWRTTRLQTEKRQLEAIVNARTREISQQKDQLAEQAEKLQELDQLKSRFFANISHEFRTPLTLISGPVDTLAAKMEDPATARTLRNVQHQADRLLDLVNQLLELARFESGQMELKRRPIDLLCLLKGLFSSFESLADQKQIQLHFDTSLDTLPASLDQEKTERLMINLIGNAIKFTPQGGAISLQLLLNQKEIEIIISDTGKGIPEDRLEDIFDRFTRIADQSEAPGTGIGLALAREIVHVHQGQIWAENIPQGGSRFIVRLPWIKPDGSELILPPVLSQQTVLSCPPSCDQVPDSSEMSPTRPLILLVEDNSDVRLYIQGILHSEYRLLSAGNGEQGLKKARAHLPDLIISDVMMPVMDGWQLCQSIKSNVATSHIPVILLTARGGDDSQVKGYEMGADDYITKPFKPALLLARISNLIRQRRDLQKVLRRHLLTEPQDITINSTDELFLREVAELLEKNYGDPLFHVEALQQKLFMGRTTLYRKLLALTGEPPSQFLRSFRLARAARLLEKGHGNVTEVSMAVGFTNPAYFSECFKQKFGVNPSQFLTDKKTTGSE